MPSARRSRRFRMHAGTGRRPCAEDRRERDRASRRTPPHRDRPGRAHRRGHRPRPPRPPHRLTPRPALEGGPCARHHAPRPPPRHPAAPDRKQRDRGPARIPRPPPDFDRRERSAAPPEPQVRTAAVPSGTNLLGLLDHLSSVERPMFLGDDVADWEATFRARRRTAWPMSWPATETRSSARTKRSTAAGPPRSRRPLSTHPHDRGDRPSRGPRGHPPRTDRRLDRPLIHRRFVTTGLSALLDGRPCHRSRRRPSFGGLSPRRVLRAPVPRCPR